MAYAINHVHVRSSDPHASASWYEEHFAAKMVSDREVMPGTITVSMEVGGPVRLNISSRPDGSSGPRAVAELNRLGLEHFGFDPGCATLLPAGSQHVEDLQAELQKLEQAGVRVVLPLTEVLGGTRLAYIEGPDDVLIELVQRA